jgi:hypothetical protein
MLTNVHYPPANNTYLLLWHKDALKSGIVQVCVTHTGHANKFNCMRNTPSADGHGNIQRINFSTPQILLFQQFHPSHFCDSKLSY